MKDWLAMVGYGLALVLLSLFCGVMILLFIASVMACLALPIILIIWALGALL